MDKQFLAKQELYNNLLMNPEVQKKTGGNKLLIQPRTLRLEALMGGETLNFTLKDKKFDTEVKLGDSDMFFFNIAALAWTKVTQDNPGYDALQYYPDPVFEPHHKEVETLYNGVGTLKEGSTTTILPETTTSVFRRVSQTQYTETGDPAKALTLPSHVDPWHYLGNGIGLIGGRDYHWIIAVGKGAKTNITGYKAVILLDGFLIPNAATKQIA